MRNHDEIDKYIQLVENGLENLSEESRTRILNDLKSFIDAQVQTKAFENKTIEDILGPASVYANREAMRGIKEVVPKRKSNTLRNILIFIFCSGALMSLCAAFIVWKFTPVFKVDEEKGKIVILGGLFEANGNFTNVNVTRSSRNGARRIVVNSSSIDLLEGSHQVSSDQRLFIKFSNAPFLIKRTLADEVSWKCSGEIEMNNSTDKIVSVEQKNVRLDFSSKSKNLKCTIKVPKVSLLDIRGQNGNISLYKPVSNSKISLENGNVTFKPERKMSYNFDIRVKNGVAVSFPSNDDVPESLEIKIDLKNGQAIYTK